MDPPAPTYRPDSRLLSCSLACDGISFESFLADAEGQARCFWACDREPLAFAGSGIVAELMAWGEGRFTTIESDARALFEGAHIVGADSTAVGPRLFGGFAFRADFTPDNTWSIYAPAHFILPHFQLTRLRGESWLTINAQIPTDENPNELIAELQDSLRQKIAALGQSRALAIGETRLRSIHYPMSQSDWQRMIEAATTRIRSGELHKVVLSRAAELRFDAPVKLLPALRRLAADYPDCYRFLFEPRPRYAFYGASPELLSRVRGRHVATMALAGSIKRGKPAAEDARLGRALLDSAKDSHEQRIVVERLRQRLDPLTESLHIGRRQLLRLKTIQHIHTPIDGVLNSGLGVLPVARALHPTPALGGAPRDKAMALIRDLEPIPRGWYGAPVGWVDAALDGQFAVAIRCAVAQESRAWIYAGAGIVEASEHESEWEETTLKFRAMLDAHHG